ncbi:MAG: hypothetical protein KGO02_09930 [Alphaproteobacteria bacterium]|nr:hypothetical protein [Alphaproteobacteria bacterium]
MKKLFAAALALSLLGSTAAFAHGDRGYGWREHRSDGNGVALAAGLGIAALAIIAATSHSGPSYPADSYYGYGGGYYPYGSYAPAASYGAQIYVNGSGGYGRGYGDHDGWRGYDDHASRWRHEDRDGRR